MKAETALSSKIWSWHPNSQVSDSLLWCLHNSSCLHQFLVTLSSCSGAEAKLKGETCPWHNSWWYCPIWGFNHTNIALGRSTTSTLGTPFTLGQPANLQTDARMFISAAPVIFGQHLRWHFLACRSQDVGTGNNIMTYRDSTYHCYILLHNWFLSFFHKLSWNDTFWETYLKLSPSRLWPRQCHLRTSESLTCCTRPHATPRYPTRGLRQSGHSAPHRDSVCDV